MGLTITPLNCCSYSTIWAGSKSGPDPAHRALATPARCFSRGICKAPAFAPQSRREQINRGKTLTLISSENGVQRQREKALTMPDFDGRYEGNGDGGYVNDYGGASPPLHQKSSGFDDMGDSRSQVQLALNLFISCVLPLVEEKYDFLRFSRKILGICW